MRIVLEVTPEDVMALPSHLREQALDDAARKMAREDARIARELRALFERKQLLEQQAGQLGDWNHLLQSEGRTPKMGKAERHARARGWDVVQT